LVPKSPAPPFFGLSELNKISDNNEEKERTGLRARIQKRWFKNEVDPNKQVKYNIEGFSIVEDKNWELASNIGAVSITCLTFFLYGFFA